MNLAPGRGNRWWRGGGGGRRGRGVDNLIQGLMVLILVTLLTDVIRADVVVTHLNYWTLLLWFVRPTPFGDYCLMTLQCHRYGWVFQ